MRSLVKGFSLIELMVVISIIAILMALGTVSFRTAQAKARDGARRADMRAVQGAFEQYFADNGDYGTNCAVMATAAYLPGGLPTDPRPSQSYACDSNDASGAPASSYCSCALMESEAGNADAPSGVTCNFNTAGTGTYFCVANQQ